MSKDKYNNIYTIAKRQIDTTLIEINFYKKSRRNLSSVVGEVNGLLAILEEIDTSLTM